MAIGIYTTLVRRWTCGEGACSRDGLPADAYLSDTTRSKCGSWLACDDGLLAEAYLPDTPTIQLWELACLRRRPNSQHSWTGYISVI